MKPLRGMAAVYLREMLILRRRILKQFASWLVSPLLYLVAFHYAMNDTLVGSRPYADFLLPGLVAMSSMTQSWAIASDINISRFYWHTFDEFQTAPLHAAAYVTGEVLAGMTRAVLACLIVMGIGLLGGIQIAYGAPGLWLALLLNAWFFSSLAVALALHVKAHADQALLSNFVITPMAARSFHWIASPVGLNMFWNSSLFPMRRKPCKPPLSDNPCVFFPAACFFLVPAPRLRGLSSVSGAHRDEPVRRALFLPHVGRVAFGTRRAFPQSLAADTSLRI